jgi:hypothetical protein
MNAGSTATTVLLLCAELGARQRASISALQLSYYLYLLQLVAPIYGRWLPGFRFHRVNYAPQSLAANTAIDFLAWHGFITSGVAGARDSLSITAAGVALTTAMRESPYVERLAQIAGDLVDALLGLGAVDLRRVCDLVFEEPAFEHELDVNPTRSDTLLPELGEQHPSSRRQSAATFAQARRRGTPPREKASAARVTLGAYLRLLAVRGHIPNDPQLKNT